jgi:hypothetical protein
VSRKNQLSAIALACGAALWASGAQAASVDDVMGNGLRELVQDADSASPSLGRHVQQFLRNDEGSPLVHVHLRAGQDANKLLDKLAAAGLDVTAVSVLDATHVEGYLPLRYARTVAGLGFVRSVAVERPPLVNAGAVQSQAVALEKADVAHRKGYSGENMRIAALSDSFDACGLCKSDAAKDVSTGDLPKGGVKVYTDLPKGNGTDEGRAMLQLIHDIAPRAHLAFASGYYGQVHFGNSILKLREEFGADVITDDLTYFEEPYYSDSLVTQAIDKAVGEGAAYFTSAGNNGIEAYEATYQPMSFSQALQTEPSNLHLEQIPEKMRPNSVHIFTGSTEKGLKTSLSNRITVGGSQTASARLDFQWDEPFDHDKVKTDYNIYIFDGAGNFIDPKSDSVTYTHDDNTKTDHPFEFATVGVGDAIAGGDTFYNDYQVVIGKMNDGGAQNIKFISVNTLAEMSYEGAPSVMGHAGASMAQGVAATYYAIPESPEDFSSPGPVTVYFDDDGNRLASPEVRQTPQITAADGVDNTFFGGDIDGNGLPNFSGTSAAAPDAAAAAALVLEAAGGHGSMTASELYGVLQSTAHKIPVANLRYRAGASAGPVTLNLHGDWTRWNEYWALSVDKSASSAVAEIDLDVSGCDNLQYNPITTRFYLGTTNGITRKDIDYTVSDDAKTGIMKFKAGSFAPGEQFHYGNSVYNPLQGSTQEDADRMRGLKMTVTMEDGTQYTGVVEAQRTRALNRYTGAGLIDAAAAIKSVTGK